MKTKHAKLGFVIAAGASFLLSVYLWFTGSKDEGVFVGSGAGKNDIFANRLIYSLTAGASIFVRRLSALP